MVVLDLGQLDVELRGKYRPRQGQRNHHLSPMASVRRITSFLDNYGSTSLGIAYDVANVEFVGEDQADAIRTAGRWLRQVHLSDASATKWDRAPIGGASVDFGAVGRALLDGGFPGTSIVELISDSPDEDMRDARARLELLGWRNPPSRQGMTGRNIEP